MKKKIIIIGISLIIVCIVAAGIFLYFKNENSNKANIVKYDENMTMLYGKVKDVAGNIATLNIAKEPGINTESSDGTNSGNSYDSSTANMSGAEIIYEGNAVVSSTTTTGSNMELEYTDEEKEITIPAGIDIFDSMGNAKNMTAIKKGSVLQMMLDKNKNITGIVILEN